LPFGAAISFLTPVQVFQQMVTIIQNLTKQQTITWQQRWFLSAYRKEDKPYANLLMVG
jgi:hypothetical protein